MHNFKAALKTSLIFLLIVLVITAILVYPYFHSEAYYYQDGYVRDSMAGTLDLIICGASQAQRGVSTKIMDDLLGCNSYNLSSPLMTLEARYRLLKKEVERNPVDLVILELCYDTMCRDRDVVGPEGDYYMLGRFTDPLERLAYFFSAARLDEYADFYYDTLRRSSYARKQWGKAAIGTSVLYENKGYSPLNANPIPMPAADAFNREPILTEMVPENLKYLDKIFALCQEKGIKVILISTPLADGAVMSYDKLDTIHQYYVELSEKWGCEFYNFSLYRGKSELFPDATAYFDRNHLSISGAETFTGLLCDIIADSLDGKESSHLFYDSYETARNQEILPRLN